MLKTQTLGAQKGSPKDGQAYITKAECVVLNEQRGVQKNDMGVLKKCVGACLDDEDDDVVVCVCVCVCVSNCV